MISRAESSSIGGGVGGCSILYWLARLGWSDVVLVERAQLTSGSTFHSAGLVGQLRSSLSLTRMMMNSVELYRAARSRGRARDRVAGGRLAPPRLVVRAHGGASSARRRGPRRSASPCTWCRPRRPEKLFPPMATEGVLGAAFLHHRRLPRPEPAHPGPRQRGAPAWGHDPDRDDGDRHRRSPVDGCRRSRPTTAGSSARSSWTPEVSTPTRSGGSPVSTCRSCPWHIST